MVSVSKTLPWLVYALVVVLCNDLDGYDDRLEKRIHQNGLPCALMNVSLTCDYRSMHADESTYLEPLQAAARANLSATSSHLQVIKELLSVPAIWYNPFQHEIEERSYRKRFVDRCNRLDVHVIFDKRDREDVEHAVEDRQVDNAKNLALLLRTRAWLACFK